MKILTEASVSKAIRSCKPTRVAVAYIGSDWKKHLPDLTSIEYVIVSPTMGTNPYAVAALVKEIGWDRVWFMDELHAKVYIGRTEAIVGSANLTKNGLSGETLTELCVSVTGDLVLSQLNKTTDLWRDAAMKQYPGTIKKKKRLSKLQELWDAAIASRAIMEPKHANNTIASFDLLSDEQFYVAWYNKHIEPEHSDELKKIETIIKDEIYFVDDDPVRKNKWILVWRSTQNGKPHGSTKPYWLYVHDVFRSGIINKDHEYNKCAIQRKDMPLPPEPFTLTESVIKAFRSAIIQPEIAKFFVQSGETFRLSKSFGGLATLVEAMRAGG